MLIDDVIGMNTLSVSLLDTEKFHTSKRLQSETPNLPKTLIPISNYLHGNSLETTSPKEPLIKSDRTFM